MKFTLSNNHYFLSYILTNILRNFLNQIHYFIYNKKIKLFTIIYAYIIKHLQKLYIM